MSEKTFQVWMVHYIRKLKNSSKDSKTLEAHSNPAEHLERIGDFLPKLKDQQLISIGRDFIVKFKTNI